MANLDDPAIREAYEDVRSDKSETNWVLLDYENDKSNVLKVTSSGSGGIPEVSKLFEKDKASFAYVRVKYANDEESFREKFVLIVWIGEGVKVMRRAKTSVYTTDVKNVFSVFSVQVNASSEADLKEDDIVTKLRKSGGANYGPGK
ncbi:adf-like domain-containing protein [Phaffia rhodozyma]|uniref:Adf-like domain-containing protein n=1 Tax=Phaffia rhodozyma TaxID=264483 RepID=A0A0F7STG8_PHARH|nr:adf-like domain-containing protein [Phaffia rhodozyma]